MRRLRKSDELSRLAGGGEGRTPPAAGRIEPLRLRGEQFDRNVNEALVEEANDEAGLARHRRMDGIASEEIAEQRIFAIRGTAPDLVARVEVTHHDRDSFLLEKRSDPVAQEMADVVELHIARGIAGVGVRGEQIL